MFSYVFMKLLESRPATYDRRMDRVSGGRVRAAKRDIAARIPAGSRVLEIGCGTGELAILLAERGCTVEGFDANPEMVREARRRLGEAGLDAGVALRVMAVEGMDRLPGDAFDAVVATLVLSELSDDERSYALEQATRALGTGGELIVADEVVPYTAAARLLQSAMRLPLLAVSYLATGTGTRPLEDPTGEMRSAGLRVVHESRGPGDAFAIVVARRDGEEAAP